MILTIGIEFRGVTYIICKFSQDKKIYDNYKIIQNKNFSKIKKLTNNVTILNKLNFENWKHIIYSSNSKKSCSNLFK